MRPFLSAAVLSLAVALPAPALADTEQDQRATEAVDVLDTLMLVPEQSVPEALLREGQAVAVFPNVIKAGLFIGGRRGHGLIAVRTADGTWSNPSFVTLTGGSIGFQAGVQSSDLVLVFRTQRGVDSIVHGKFTLGADAAVATGPVGRNAQASTDEQFKAEIFAYSRARGLFAGVSIDGAVMSIDHRANQDAYGPNTTPRAIFEGRVDPPSNPIVDFRDRLEEYTSSGAAPTARGPGPIDTRSPASVPTTGQPQQAPQPGAAATSPVAEPPPASAPTPFSEPEQVPPQPEPLPDDDGGPR